jgi:tRNA nucleotidyltransferase (CCA-adding enzyme)
MAAFKKEGGMEKDHDVKIYQVGGSIRDEVMAQDPHDIDYAVEVLSFQVMLDWIKAHDGEALHPRPEFGSVKIRWRPKDSRSYVADFTMCRKDGFYGDGRHPTTIQPGSLLDDLSRRDFTMNAMARRCIFDPITSIIKPTSEPIIDPFGGQKDIEAKRIVCVGDATTRLKEDSLRVLRALRFSICFGFTIDSQLESALQMNTISAAVSNERIAEEFNKCLRHDTLGTLALLHKTYPHLLQTLFRHPQKFTLKLVIK